MIGYKYNGCGNKFILIDEKETDLSKSDILFNTQSLCKNENYKADGILYLEKSQNADIFMNIINSDGSIAKMCGNGVRCVAQYLHNQNPNKKLFKIDTLSGLKIVKILSSNQNTCVSSVKIGKAKVKNFNKMFDSIQETLNFDYVNIGNEHIVFYPDEQILRKKQLIYESLQKNNGINVEFINEINGNNIKVRVFERGCGETMACGTGATAVAFSLFNKNCGNNFNIIMPGGTLNVKIINNMAYLEGPTVFDGLENYNIKEFECKSCDKE